MKALVFTTNNTAYSREFPEPLFESAHEVIDDLIEVVRPLGLPGYIMLVDESGLLKNWQTNVVGSLFYGTQFHGHPIVGDIVIVKEQGRKEPKGLTDDEIQKTFSLAKAYASVFGHEIRWEEPNEHS